MPLPTPRPETSARILLAEDDKEMRSLLARILRRDGCEVIEAHDGVQLTELLSAEMSGDADGPGVDLIISDICMPGATGLDVLSMLRQEDCSTPVILMTAFGDGETHAEAQRMGATAVFNKPFDLDDLRTVVGCFCDVHWTH